VFHYGGEALHYAGVGLSYANTVGERIVGSVVDSVVSSVESPYECVAGLIEGEYRNAAPACLKTAALAALLVLPGGLELSAGRDVVGSWLERLVYEERGSIFAGEEAPSIKAGAAGGETAGRKFAPSVRQTALNRNPSTCVYCRMETNSPQVDHAIPRARGGDATLENAQTTCRHCNASKGMRDYPRSPPPGYRGPWPPPWWQR
jgi:hypothetical protein